MREISASHKADVPDPLTTITEVSIMNYFNLIQNGDTMSLSQGDDASSQISTLLTFSATSPNSVVCNFREGTIQVDAF